MTIESMLVEYQTRAHATAIYPDITNVIEHPKDKRILKLVYPVLGLFDEIGELKSKIDDPTKTDEDIKGEMGDVSWYVNETSVVLDFTMTELYEMGEVVGIEVKRQLIDFDTLMVKEAAKIAGIVKKGIRDTGMLSDEKIKEIKVSLAKIVYCLRVFGSVALQTTYEVILSENIKKLESRKQRNVIKGSGDNR